MLERRSRATRAAARWAGLTLSLLATGPALAWCFVDAGLEQGVHPHLLRAIARQESGLRPDVVRRNKNGTFDVGLMQINSSWFPKLREVGRDPERLREPCYNIRVGAWILAQELRRHGHSAKGVGAYHSQNPELQQRYVTQLYSRSMRPEGR